MNKCATYSIHSAMLENHLLTSENIIMWDEKEHCLNEDISCARKFRNFKRCQPPLLNIKSHGCFGNI